MPHVAHIFGGEAKVKIMRLFIFNPDATYLSQTVADRTQENAAAVRREIRRLIKAGLIKKRKKGYTLNHSYTHLSALEHFLIDAAPISPKEIIKRVSKSGVIKLVLLSGIFIHDSETRVDLLIVGDHLKKKVLTTAITAIEAELGKEIRYAAFETADFQYRLGMYDKLIRDILDYPHEKILNKINL